MNTYLLGLAGKWCSIICMAFSSLLNSGLIFSEEKFEVENVNQTKNGIASITEVAYPTENIYNEKLPSNIIITKQKGKVGLAYTDQNSNQLEILEEPVTEIVEIGTGAPGEFVGKMTGYGADCAGCSSAGTLSCRTESGQSFSLTKNGETYDDDEFGTVRILAAALDKFPCGTIIKVSGSNLGTFNAVVMDTGSAMRNAYKNGIILMDLAFVSESHPDIFKATGSNIKYSVQRWGW